MKLLDDSYNEEPYEGNFSTSFAEAIQPVSCAYVPSSGAKVEGVLGNKYRTLILRSRELINIQQKFLFFMISSNSFIQEHISHTSNPIEYLVN